MGEVRAEFSMSLDGYVADSEHDISALYEWMVGAVDIDTSLDDMNYTEQGTTARTSRSHRSGAIVCGRRTFDLAQGWGGRHPLDVPVIVVTHREAPEWSHRPSPFTFVEEGVVAAMEVAHRAAEGKDILVCGPEIMRQCATFRLLDALAIDLVPTVLGGGVPLFGDEPFPSLDLASSVSGADVTHLRFELRKEELERLESEG